ncbi:MAG TPA: Xaa-Pro peptidase family protein [Acidimicrobiia bacterium]|nr:Xaa-Pro peptidase family protein [Acidimicrobiia bacterium]
MSFDFDGRVARLKEVMGRDGIDVALLSIGADLPYFTGYEAKPSERLTVLVVPVDDSPVLYVPVLEAPGVPPGAFEVRPWTEVEDPVALAAATTPTPEIVAVGDHMWSVFLTRFQAIWTKAAWRPASEITSSLRLMKDTDEIDLLRRAAHGVDRVMARVPTEVPFAGRTELEVARDLAEMTIEEGHDVAEFTIVASGPNGASPHHHPGHRRIEEGDLVVCDFGGRIGGYYSDSTRTFSVGTPDQRRREIHEIVATANETGRAAIKPGVLCQDIDNVTRAVVEDSGYGGYFIHRTGHGIGLEVHEHPYIVDGNETILQPGMCFSVEPGIYLPDEFGVRIEDIVVCTDDGVDSLNQSERGLVHVG